MASDDRSDSGTRPFELHVDDATLDDLRERLGRARILPASPDRPWSALDQGHLADLVETWRDLDWRARERWLAAHPQVLVDVDGTRIHAAHLRAERDDAPALLVMHGWPHTFQLQLGLADLLHDMHVVVASMPGFAWSEPYASGPHTEERVAATMHGLMQRLGHERYLTYGEDVSANVSDLIAARHPDAVLGIVATHAHFPYAAERAALTDPEAIAFFARLDATHGPDGAYAHLQATRPDTLAAALNDSPTGLLAWLVDKLAEWSDTGDGLGSATASGVPTFERDPATNGGSSRDLERRISRERILTEATIYWVTQSIASSFRPYFEQVEDPPAIPAMTVPAAVHIQRHEHDYPESVARAFYRDLRVFDRLAEGGHFAAAEAPEVLAAHIRSFATELGLLRA